MKNSRRPIAVLILSLFLALGFSLPCAPAMAMLKESTPEMDVYSAILYSLYADTKLLIIEKNVSGCVGIGKNVEGARAWEKGLDQLPGKLAGLSAETLASFKQNFRQCRQVELENFPVKYVLLGRQEKSALFSRPDTKKAWEDFYRKYPGASGYINFSNIGFNPDRTQALIDTYRKCGAKCGAEKMVLLTKHNGQWAVKATHKIWEL